MTTKAKTVTRESIREELGRRRFAVTSAIEANRRATRDAATAQQEAAKDPYGGASATHDSEVAVVVAEQIGRASCRERV